DILLSDARGHAFTAIPDASHVERDGCPGEAGDSESTLVIRHRALCAVGDADLCAAQRFVAADRANAARNGVVLSVESGAARGDCECRQREGSKTSKRSSEHVPLPSGRMQVANCTRSWKGHQVRLFTHRLFELSQVVDVGADALHRSCESV